MCCIYISLKIRVCFLSQFDRMDQEGFQAAEDRSKFMEQELKIKTLTELFCVSEKVKPTEAPLRVGNVLRVFAEAHLGRVFMCKFYIMWVVKFLFFFFNFDVIFAKGLFYYNFFFGEKCHFVLWYFDLLPWIYLESLEYY